MIPLAYQLGDNDFEMEYKGRKLIKTFPTFWTILL